jgi:hypothetical protein
MFNVQRKVTYVMQKLRLLMGHLFKSLITSSNSSSEMTMGWATSGSLPFAFALRWEVLVAVPGVGDWLPRGGDTCGVGL